MSKYTIFSFLLIIIFFSGCSSIVSRQTEPKTKVVYVKSDSKVSLKKVKRLNSIYVEEVNKLKPVSRQKEELIKDIDKEIDSAVLYNKQLGKLSEKKISKRKSKKSVIVRKYKKKDKNYELKFF